LAQAVNWAPGGDAASRARGLRQARPAASPEPPSPSK
jgi:hypothetical protein